ncbi:hypothetical protein LINPERHAP2_LOCUS33264, partial [Linum perenne]
MDWRDEYLDVNSNLSEVPLESSVIRAFVIRGRETVKFVMAFPSW